VQCYAFIRQNGDWYIDLPEYLSAGGKREDLQMVAGADELLDLYAKEHASVLMHIDMLPFEGADHLHLLEAEGQMTEGGACYTVYSVDGRSLHPQIWLCNVLLFVFGKIPEDIYIKKLSGK
jgi:hypothetical protein